MWGQVSRAQKRNLNWTCLLVFTQQLGGQRAGSRVRAEEEVVSLEGERSRGGAESRRTCRAFQTMTRTLL